MMAPSRFENPNVRRSVPEIDGHDHDSDRAIFSDHRGGPLESPETVTIDSSFSRTSIRCRFDLHDDPLVPRKVRGENVDFDPGDPAISRHDAQARFRESDGGDPLAFASDLGRGVWWRPAATRCPSNSFADPNRLRPPPRWETPAHGRSSRSPRWIP